jgi:hypothetical protein
MVGLGSENIEMLEAAILQKTERIKHIPFTDAIDKKENVRKIPYALIPLSIVLILLIAAPTVIKDPAQRISNYRVHYERPMPFSFKVSHNQLNILKGDDLDLNIRIEGSEFPAEVFVEYDKKVAKSARLANNEFVYRFRNLNQDLSFRLQAGGFFSETYRVRVMPKPVILNYNIALSYPAYINRAPEALQNTGDFSVPIGTTITWLFTTESVDSVILRASKATQPETKRESENTFESKIRAMESFDYVVIPVNKHAPARDSLLHQVAVIPDLYPEIQVETFIDSSNYRMAFFTGHIKDDYGFDKLLFHLQRRNIKSPERLLEEETRTVPIDKTVNNQSFFYTIDFTDSQIEPGDRIEYWFEVWDNDRVNGSKSSRSGMGAIEVPEISEQQQQIADKQTEMSEEMKHLQRGLKELSRELISYSDPYYRKKVLAGRIPINFRKCLSGS